MTRSSSEERRQCLRCGRLAIVSQDSGHCRPCINKQTLDANYQQAARRHSQFDLPQTVEYSSPFTSTRAPMDGDISAVWVYWAGGAKNDELRYSIRSTEANLQGISNYIICGDVPSWFTGGAIPSSRTTAGGISKKWVDSIVKLQRIIDSELVTERFVWLYDDTFFLKPIHAKEFYNPFAAGSLPLHSMSGTWGRTRAITARMLEAAGMPRYDYSTHCPIVYEKDRLQKTINEFRCRDYPALIESLYCNQWHREARHGSAMFAYTNRPSQGWSIPDSVKVVNVGQFNAPAASVIKPLFPMASSLEAVEKKAKARPKITAILNAYARPANFNKQLACVNNQTVRPSEVMVWQNSSEKSFEKCSLGSTVHASANTNFGVWARFAYALNARTEFVCVFDDDTIPGSEWFANCLETIETFDGLLGAAGVVFKTQHSYYPCKMVGWRMPCNHAVRCDIVGHAWFFRREWLSHFWSELPSSDQSLFAGEDFHFSYMLQKQGIGTYVPPHPKANMQRWGSVAAHLGRDAVALSGKKLTHNTIKAGLPQYVEKGFRLLCQ
jgi:hypothetical protein